MKTRIVCAGTFDKLHTGHLEFFKQSKKLEDNTKLIVIVARDKNSEDKKGKPTTNSEETRLKRIKELEIVDEAVLGYENDLIGRVISLKPDIMALGHDQWAKEEWLEDQFKNRNLNIKIVRMPKFKKNYLD